MEKRLTMFLACLFLSLGIALAQTQISGTVVSSEDGEPVIGASVIVVGTKTGTATDIDGKFTVKASAGDKLEISYIGMITKTVTASPNMKVTLYPDNKTLEEVMVVAFGTQKKSAFTGSAAVVDSKALAKHVTTNVADALVGTVAGLQMRGGSGQPGANQGKMSIRGISSLEASTDPLIIVDGAPYSASLSNIPQEDIESVTVLKDAASAALYGARGAAGVILITTKRGTTAEAIVNVDMKWGSNSRAVQEYDKIDDPARFYEAFYGMMYNKYFFGNGMDAAAANLKANTDMLNQLGYNVYTVPKGEQLIGMNGRLNPNATLGRSYTTSDGQVFYMQPDNWTDAAYKNSFRQEYNVSVSGGGTKSSFYASAGYLKDDGIIEFSGFERITARAKADLQAKKWLRVGVNVGYVHSRQKSNPNMDTSLGSGNLMYFTSSMAPIYPIFVRTLDAQGNPIIRTDQYGNPQYDYGVPAANFVENSPRAFSAQGNPLGANRYNSDKSVGNQMNGTFTAEIKFTDWLKLNINSNANWGETTVSKYTNMLYGPGTSTNGKLVKYQSNTLRSNNVQTLNFHKSFNAHDLEVMLGHEYYNTKTRYVEGTASGGFSPDIQELGAFAKKEDNTSYTTRYNVEGWFGRAQYNYNEKYYASASLRRDASSRFDPNHRWGTFWSLGAAWNVTKEAWFNAKWVDFLKLKLSVGQLGNDAIGNWRYTNLYSLKKASDTQMSPQFSSKGNENITWETITNANFGVEFGILKNRLMGSIDVYSKKTTDMLFWLSIPESSGTRGYFGNIGDMRNRGIELSLTGVPVQTKDFKWTVTASIAHNTTKILSLPESKTTDNGGYVDNGTGIENWYTVGGPLYNAFLPEYAGVNESGQALYWVDTNVPQNERSTYPSIERNATTTNKDLAGRYTQGSILPKASGGFNTTFEYRNFDASFSFDYQLGGKVMDVRYQSLMTPVESKSSGTTFSTDIFKAWSPDNTSSDIPRFWYGDKYTAANSTRWLTSASYLNFQSFTVGYNVPKSLCRKLNLSRVRVYVAGENLYFWSARKGFDPRFSFAETKDVNVYSPTRNISGGIQVSF